MSFFQVDDKWFSNPKVRAMIETESFTKASLGLALWTLTGSLARGAGFDGVITLGSATSVTLDRAAARRGAALLVTYRLWHAGGHDCEACPQPPEGSWIFHQWFQFDYGTADAERTAVAKRQELRRPAVVEAVWARDTHPDGKPRCRYCEKVVRRQSGKGGDRRSVTVGHLDHVDPTKAVGASNIAVACAECNQRKAQRTPEQAGMTLLPSPADQYENQSAVLISTNPESIREVSPPRARAGAAAGTGAGVGTGVRVGLGEGEGLGDGGAGRAGPAPVVPVPAAFGSPWKGHHGAPPPADLIEEATCPTHRLPRPCRTCAAVDRESA